jgi:hypothetical protein
MSTDLLSILEDLLDRRAPISIKFEIPYFTVSGIQVRYLKIVEKSGYQALRECYSVIEEDLPLIELYSMGSIYLPKWRVRFANTKRQGTDTAYSFCRITSTTTTICNDYHAIPLSWSSPSLLSPKPVCFTCLRIWSCLIFPDRRFLPLFSLNKFTKVSDTVW